MIKKEEYQQHKQYLCINPYCQQSKERFCHSSSSHFNAHQCAKWIVDTTNLQIIQPAPFTAKELNNIQINFSEEPLKGMHLVDRLRHSEWNKWLCAQMNRLKKEVNACLQTQFEAVTTKIEEFINDCPQQNTIYKIIQESNNPQSALNQFFQQNRSRTEDLENVLLFNKNGLKDRMKIIKDEIKKIFETIYTSRKVQQKYQDAGNTRAFHHYIFQQVDHYYNKIQVLAAALNKQVTNYSIAGEMMSLECILCQKKYCMSVRPVSKKIVKKDLAQHLLTHLYCSHHQQVYFAYNRKVVPRHYQSFTFEEFIDASSNYKTIRLIDRQTGAHVDETYADFVKNQKTFTLEVLSTSNPHMIKGRHLLVPSHESIGLMIAIVAYVCSQRDQSIIVISNRPGLKRALDELIEMKAPIKQQNMKVKQQ